MEEIYDYLKQQGMVIGQAARKGDEKAKAVISAYGMHQGCPSDPGAQGVLMTAVDDWKAQSVNRQP